ncbi:hypothetical protein FHETE_5282 [Fusarium heterosporum]|uniref:Uncharacterized protein n=1 Tax=Fusarium heterosporum TaxID=42747 RepID=A0A8H5TEP5_FUSHE|nr:hypothetical protein FHETE_5282 [Fusarium heterosporum]
MYNFRHDCAEAQAMASAGAGLFSQNLAAPKATERIDGIEDGKNISTYLTDGGLWLACKESRSIIDDHFQQSKWDSRRKRRAQDSREYVAFQSFDEEILHMPATGYFVGEPPQYFTVFPHRDLFILQADSLEIIDWAAFDYNIPFSSESRGFEGIRHFGIEYKREWGVLMQAEEYFEDMDIVKTFLRAALEITGRDRTIFIIDYNLKVTLPLEESDSSASSPAVFYANDRKLVEVDTDYFSVEKRRSLKSSDSDGHSYWSSSIEFVESLCDILNESDSSEMIETGMFYNCSFMLLGMDSS